MTEEEAVKAHEALEALDAAVIAAGRMADFKRKTHAMIFATSFAGALDTVIDDKTFRKERS